MYYNKMIMFYIKLVFRCQKHSGNNINTLFRWDFEMIQIKTTFLAERKTTVNSVNNCFVIISIFNQWSVPAVI